MNAIEIQDLHKSYGQTKVLQGINLTVKSGSLLALLGPNGAGKTTTVRILATLLRFNAGTVKVFGHDVLKDAHGVRRRVSLTGQFASVDDDLTGLENLTLVARLQGFNWHHAKHRAQELLAAFELTHAAKRQVKHYSGGMRRRLDIAASIVVQPELLFLDEPTTGLDPRSRRQIWEIIRKLRAAGTTVLLTTQYLEEADALADRIVIINHGTIIADGTPSQLKSSVGSGVLRVRLQDATQSHHAQNMLVQFLQSDVQMDSDGSTLLAQVTDDKYVISALEALVQAEIDLAEYALGQPSLDDVFLALTENDVASDNHMTKELG